MAVIARVLLLAGGQALLQSFQQSDAFGTSTEWVGLRELPRLFGDPTYLASFWTTALFSVLVAGWASPSRCCWRSSPTRGARRAGLPHAADLALRGGAGGGRRAVAVHVRAQSIGIVSYALRSVGIDWNHLLHSGQAMTLIVAAAVWKQLSYNFLFFLAGLQSIPKSLDRGGGDRRRAPWRRFWTIQFPLLSPTTFFLFVINVVYAFFDTFAIVDAATQGGPGKDTAILVYKVYYDGFKALDLGGSAAQSVVLMAIVVALTVVQFRFVEKKVTY